MIHLKTYADVFPQWQDGLQRLPNYMQGAVERYILHGIQPGHFLTAVVENNLHEAMKRADSTNVQFIREYVVFFDSFAPANCWGSPQIVRDWMNNAGALGLMGEAASDADV